MRYAQFWARCMKYGKCALQIGLMTICPVISRQSRYQELQMNINQLTSENTPRVRVRNEDDMVTILTKPIPIHCHAVSLRFCF